MIKIKSLGWLCIIISIISSCNYSYYKDAYATYRVLSKHSIAKNNCYITSFTNDSTILFQEGYWRGSDTLYKDKRYDWACKNYIHLYSTFYSPGRHDTFYFKNSDIYTYFKGRKITYFSYSLFLENKPTYYIYSLGSSNEPQLEILNPLYIIDSVTTNKIYVFKRVQYNIIDEDIFFGNMEAKQGIAIDKETDTDTLFIIPGIGQYYHRFYTNIYPFKPELAKMQDLKFNKKYYRIYKNNFLK